MEKKYVFSDENFMFVQQTSSKHVNPTCSHDVLVDEDLHVSKIDSLDSLISVTRLKLLPLH